MRGGPRPQNGRLASWLDCEINLRTCLMAARHPCTAAAVVPARQPSHPAHAPWKPRQPRNERQETAAADAGKTGDFVRGRTGSATGISFFATATSKMAFCKKRKNLCGKYGKASGTMPKSEWIRCPCKSHHGTSWYCQWSELSIELAMSKLQFIAVSISSNQTGMPFDSRSLRAFLMASCTPPRSPAWLCEIPSACSTMSTREPVVEAILGTIATPSTRSSFRANSLTTEQNASTCRSSTFTSTQGILVRVRTACA
mmetsp:Transcript_46371/g.138626  ORF Transcript_46371/g.138626 Transcript_46371/m.138626 type:complete len:256 (+) Transcript_46371:592-1359(+)